jgi:uncharacterized membrane-anchored protein
MREIAYTTFGRNALVCGLISHIAALLVGMATVAGGELYFTIIFPFSWFVLVLAAFAELKNRGYDPASDWQFYGMAVVTVIPLIGPFTLLVRLYRFQKSGPDDRVRAAGFFSAFLRLKANVLVMFVVIIILFLLFAVIQSRHDPYFKRRAPTNLSLQSIFVADQHKSNFQTIKSDETVKS